MGAPASLRARVPALCAWLALALWLACMVASTAHGQELVPAPPAAASIARDPLRWVSSCGQLETYRGAPLSGRIGFTPCAQALEISLRGGADERIERVLPLAPLRAQWIATTFAQIAPHELVVAGYDFERGCGLVLRLVFAPATWELAAVHEVVASENLLGPAALEPFADGKRVAVLDRETASVHVLDIEHRRLDLIHRNPSVREMRDVSAEELDTGGVMLWLTDCDSQTAYHAPPTLLGPTISLYDWDGDGVFESVHGPRGQ